jgi:hypothetical protein
MATGAAQMTNALNGERPAKQANGIKDTQAQKKKDKVHE